MTSRRNVAKYITARDNGVACDWTNVVLCAGASEGIRAVLKMMTAPGAGAGAGDKKPGVMIPTPQYPLYSASLAEYDMEQVGEGENIMNKLLGSCFFFSEKYFYPFLLILYSLIFFYLIK